MRDLRLREIVFCVLLYFSSVVNGLKCRAATEAQDSNDFEYVVRMCLRHLRNESDIYDLYRMQSDYDSSRNKRYRDDASGDSNSNNNNSNNNNNDSRNYYNRNRGYPEGFGFWPSNNPPHDSYPPCRNDDDRNRQDGDYEESDYFGLPRNGKEGRKTFKGRSQPPHSYQQQLQHDRDVLYGRGNRDSSNFYSNRNKNTMFNRNGNSPLADIDPCVIHCIFQEMQMVDNSGRPNKALISQKMSQKVRNSQLKNFIQESVEECFEAIQDNDFGSYGSNSNNNNNNSNNRYRKQENVCEWAKTFAICLEDRGRENCEDWNEPFQKNHNSNNGNNKNTDSQRHKSKQNDRG